MNAAQQQAVMHAKGPAMVLAGPGSGKTTVITERLKYLIEQKAVDPATILVITFTKASAVEMQMRFLKLTDSSYPEVLFGTFHSVFYQMIRNSLSDKNSKPEIADIRFQTELIKDILAQLKAMGRIGREEFEEGCERIPDILSEISRIKNMDSEPESCSDRAPLKNVFPEIFDSYGRKIREFGKIDFDDMMVRCLALLTENESILKFWQKRFRYILIDEYQDINPVQSRIIDLILGEEKNLFAVGDDDQSIYGFRGSDPGIMLKFMEKFETSDAKLINLNINYRSGSDILHASQLVIKENKIRLQKDLAAFEGNGNGSVITRRYDSRQKQSEAIAHFLDKHRDQLSDIALLFRTNSEARALLPVLRQYNIPTNLDSFEENIYKDKAVQTLVSYLEFAYEGQSRSDFYRIMNVPMRYISREAAGMETVTEKELLSFYRDNPGKQKTVRDFFRVIHMISHLRPALSVRYLRRSVGLDSLFEKSINALNELENEAQKFEDSRKFLEYVKEKTAESDNAVKRKRESTSKERVNLLTMHASKGLEFGIVWLADLNEGIIPSRSATDAAGTEEERRMLYVAMTRAKRALIMSYIKGSKENPMLPSRFLRPIRQLWDEHYS